MWQICPFLSADVDSCGERIMGKFKTTSSCVYHVILSQLFHNIYVYKNYWNCVALGFLSFCQIIWLHLLQNKLSKVSLISFTVKTVWIEILNTMLKNEPIMMKSSQFSMVYIQFPKVYEAFSWFYVIMNKNT